MAHYRSKGLSCEEPGKKKFNLRYLRFSLRFRPKLFNLIMNMRQTIMKQKHIISKLRKQLQNNMQNSDKLSYDNDNSKKSTQTLSYKTNKKKVSEKDNIVVTDPIIKKEKDATKEISIKTDETVKTDKEKLTAWNLENGDTKTIADQVKEVAQSALQQNGMVYVESAGMYYDYKTGYYYNADLGLYYHTHTSCYYYYSEENKEFVFHSYPDKSVMNFADTQPPRKAKKHKKVPKEDEVNKLTKNLSQATEGEASKPKRRKIKKEKKNVIIKCEDEINLSSNNDTKVDQEIKKEISNNDIEKSEDTLEDGECSETEESGEEEESVIDISSVSSDDDTVAKHHPPCMRLIVSDAKHPEVKIGTLYLVTKDGGTLGSEGKQHIVVINDRSISRIHLYIRYNMAKKVYEVTDMGSKNGTIVNGTRISQSETVSEPVEIPHRSSLQLGDIKLQCHIHPGNETCGHCEPGLVIQADETEKKVAYTRTCSVKKQYSLELARLKNKYTPELKAIEDGAYNDRAKARREEVGSSHHAEKTQTNDLDTFIAPENKGFKLLEKMGWSKGEGLGKDNQGDAEPIPIVSNEGKAGLGAAGGPPPQRKPSNSLGPATLRLAAKTKMLQPPAKAFQNNADEDSE